MLIWAVAFLIIAIAAGILGFVVVVGIAALIAKALFFIFLIFFVLSLIFGRRAPSV